MKNLASIVLLVGLCCSTGWVSAKSHREVDASSQVDEEREVDVSVLKARCDRVTYPCLEGLKAHMDEMMPVMDMIQNLRLTGANRFCVDYTAVSNCLEEKRKEPECRHKALEEYVNPYHKKLSAIINIACVQNYIELNNHWDCLLDINNERSPFETCKRVSFAKKSRECSRENFAPVVECYVEWYSQHSSCGAGTAELIREVLPEIMAFEQFRCNVPVDGPLKKSLLKLFRMK